ncbi:hypothetical protein CANARDRAFT_26752 [[Candida] arabinofermentans NRRL YB-2248]|uniref:RNA polymerase II subunit A C-terminal domain phosphatase n=1 Tax=[Candida] arabinofermentans NRRL YB-2248 TaxID=983967 RepID=A0A1E4T6G2_9ASCO|nr:hypothetical protein CANARDRAFT_26752 [[Candida] arabinofermentans NRRL YB-2248]
MTDSSQVYLPANLPYPLTIVKIAVDEGSEIKRHSTVLHYRYFDFEPVPLSEQDEEKSDESERKLIKVEYVGSFECPLEGKISKVNVKVGDKLKDSSTVVIEIIEPCTHAIQYGGLCAICGKPVEDGDYSGFNDKDRAPISMSHGTTNLKVSAKEAASIEKSSTQSLLRDQRLSLVVDLDQTVIHATVDPTVGEWMSDPQNPNYESIKDVKSFSLEEEAIVPPGYTGPKPPPHLRWYYVKLRPGLHQFLENISKLYELHIYTMATRVYAKSIAKIIDPDGIYFGDRILSRDESGSLTQKSLKRLFPVDTSMVVVIDDRGDVWNWSPNLIKVVPYDFFVGIGDINSSFLPRQNALLGPSKRRKSVSILEDQLNSAAELRSLSSNAPEEAVIDEDDESESDHTEHTPKSSGNKDGGDGNDEDGEGDADTSVTIDIPLPDQGYSPVDRMMELGEGDDNTELLAAQESERTTTLEQQLHERPLAKLQENLEKIIEEEETKSSDSSSRSSKVPEEKEAHNLLCDDDTELETLGQALLRIHNEFYFEVERSEKHLPDVKDIMTSMKSLVFREYVFLLSGILPMGTRLETADIVIWAKSFGATFVTNYTKAVTHVICKNPGTFKVRLSKSIDPNVFVVNPDWLFSCIAQWEKVPEDDFIVPVNDLLSKEEIASYMEGHNIEGDNAFNGAELDWGEIDKEMEEFIDSDEEDDDISGNDEDGEETNDVATAEDSTEISVSENASLKRRAEQDAAEDDIDESMPDASFVEKRQKTDTSRDDEESDDEFEKSLLQDLADLEEEEEENSNAEQ